jgi:hypothetical protein
MGAVNLVNDAYYCATDVQSAIEQLSSSLDFKGSLQPGDYVTINTINEQIPSVVTVDGSLHRIVTSDHITINPIDWENQTTIIPLSVDSINIDSNPDFLRSEIEELKDEIQLLKDELNELKMILLEN